MQEIMTVDNVSALERSQIETLLDCAAKRPRNLKESINRATEMATFSQEIAESCIYAVPRAGKTLTGPSIRLAEIMLSTWKNIHCGTRLVKNDGRFIAVEAVVIDLETNVRFNEVVERSIMTSAKNGKTPQQFSYDMQQTVAAAAASIALRKAAFRIIPKQFVEMVFSAAKDAAIGKAVPILVRAQKALDYFKKLTIQPETIFKYLEIEKIEDMDKEHIAILIGKKNMIDEGNLTIETAFVKFNEQTGEVNSPRIDDLKDMIDGA